MTPLAPVHPIWPTMFSKPCYGRGQSSGSLSNWKRRIRIKSQKEARGRVLEPTKNQVGWEQARRKRRYEKSKTRERRPPAIIMTFDKSKARLTVTKCPGFQCQGSRKVFPQSQNSYFLLPKNNDLLAGISSLKQMQTFLLLFCVLFFVRCH